MKGHWSAKCATTCQALLSARLLDSVSARAYAVSLDTTGLGRDLARSVRASLAWAQGNARAALAELQQFPFEAPPPAIFWVGTHERFLYAEVLLALGREAEALDWYGSVRGSFSLGHVAPAHLRQAQISQRLGRRADAIRHYTRFIAQWRDCDPELRPLVEEARRAVARLTPPRSPT